MVGRRRMATTMATTATTHTGAAAIGPAPETIPGEVGMDLLVAQADGQVDRPVDLPADRRQVDRLGVAVQVHLCRNQSRDHRGIQRLPRIFIVTVNHKPLSARRFE